jgi:hypothetical protein
MRRTVGLSLVLLATLCGCGDETPKNSQSQEQTTTEEQQTLHLKVSPPPKLGRSQERANLIKRLNRFNSDSKVSYIYLVNYGKVMAFYTVKGKVSSVNSLLTTPEQVVDHIWHGSAANWKQSSHVVASPDLDGSYGTNGDAVFFFTTDDTYVEWRGDYMLCDKPLKLATPPEMVIHVGNR